MGPLSWILFGLLAGAFAKLAVAGRQRLGCLATLAVGLVGSVIGGFAGEALLDEEVEFGWDLGPFLLAVLGAALFLLLLDSVARRRGR